MNIKKKTAEVIKNILAIKYGEKSVMVIGEIKTTIPKTRVAQLMTLPIKSPKISQDSPFLAETMPK